MKDDEFDKMLSELGVRTTEPVRPTLADDIKAHIPSRLAAHRRGMHTINIIIDLRVGKVAAAIAVVVTLVLLAGLLGGRNSDGILNDSKLLARHLLGAGHKEDRVTAESMREYLVEKGEDVIFYDNVFSRQDSNSMLMHWKLAEDRYQVVFRDYRVKEVSAAELIKLQAEMLQQHK